MVSEVLRRERFESHTDIVEAVKTAAARARIRYTSAMVWDAVATVDQHRGGIVAAPTKVTPVRLKPDHGPLSRNQALEALARLEKENHFAVQVPTWR